MKDVEKISITIRKDVLKILRKMHKESGYRSFSEFIDKKLFATAIPSNLENTQHNI